MNLPRKDKDGISRLSYSQISLFKRSKKEYYESYIEGKPFEGNEYTDFGSKVGEALEHNDFKAFKKDEQETLKKVKRLDEFERMVKLNYDGFYIDKDNTFFKKRKNSAYFKDKKFESWVKKNKLDKGLVYIFN